MLMLGDFVRTILTAQSRKAWIVFLGPIVGAVAARYFGVDLGACQDVVTGALGDGLGGLEPVLTGLTAGGPLGVLLAYLGWRVPNAPAR